MPPDPQADSAAPSRRATEPVLDMMLDAAEAAAANPAPAQQPQAPAAPAAPATPPANAVADDPDPVQPPSTSPPSMSLLNNLLTQAQAAFQANVGGTYQQGFNKTGSGTVSIGLPAFGKNNDHNVQIGVTEGNTGAGAQIQVLPYVDKEGTGQNTVLTSLQFGMDPKLSAQLGINVEFDRGGDNPSRPKYQHVVQVYAGYDQNAQIGNAGGDGTTVGVSVLEQKNFGLSKDLNPKYSLGVEVKIQGTHLDGEHVNEALETVGIVGAYNWTTDGGKTVYSVGAGAYVGAEAHTNSGPNTVAGVGISAGVAIGGKDAPKPAAPGTDSPDRVVERKTTGIVSLVDAAHDKVVLDTGEGHTSEFKISELKGNSPDPQGFADSMRRGERLEIVTHNDRSYVEVDHGRDDEWRKDSLVGRAQALPNGDLKIDNLTIRGDDAELYKRWLTKPEAKDPEILSDLEQKAASNDPQTIGVPARPGAPDFTRGSSNLPAPSVHMGAGGTGAVRSGGVSLNNCTLTSLEDKGGITTIHYTLGGHPMAMSVPDTVGGYAKDPSNPAGDKALDDALARGAAPEQARNAASAGARNLIRDLDAQNGPAPLVSPKGTTPEALLSRMTYDPNTVDVHIGNLTIKKDAAAYYIGTIATKGADHPEMIAQLERLADSPQPTTIDLAKTREAAQKERDARGFGEPPNPVKTAFELLKPNESFDFNIARNGEAKLVNQTEHFETPIQKDGVGPQQPVAPQAKAPHHERSL